MSVSVSGRILINCWSGCSINKIAAQIEADTGTLLPRRTVRDDDAIRSVAEAVNGATFAGRTAATDRAVLRALLEISRRIGSLEIGASLRELAEIGKIQQATTVSGALKRLRQDGWIERIERGSLTGAARYRLKASNRTLRGRAVRYNAAIYCELFRRGRGLGPAAGRVFSAIVELGPIDARKIALALGFRDTQPVRRQLKRLSANGLIRGFKIPDRKGLAYDLGPKSEFELEEELGLIDATKKQRQRHDEEREQYRIRSLEQTGGTAWSDGEVIDKQTGEVLIDRQGRMPNPSRRKRGSDTKRVIVTVDDPEAAARFLQRLGGRIEARNKRSRM
jgi:DNA-binding MarR family transcriptional regulator